MFQAFSLRRPWFNPPTAFHMGGVWERQIKSARKILKCVLYQQVLDEECLDTVLCEADNIVNGRPFTLVSGDPQDWNAITPNSLLLLLRTETLAFARVCVFLFSSSPRSLGFLSLLTCFCYRRSLVILIASSRFHDVIYHSSDIFANCFWSSSQREKILAWCNTAQSCRTLMIYGVVNFSADISRVASSKGSST